MLKWLLKNEEAARIDPLIDTLTDEMHAIGVNDDRYPIHLEHLERLYKIKAAGGPGRISLDNMVLVAGNLLGILTIVAYEQKHVMTTRGLQQLLRPRNI